MRVRFPGFQRCVAPCALSILTGTALTGFAAAGSPALAAAPASAPAAAPPPAPAAGPQGNAAAPAGLLSEGQQVPPFTFRRLGAGAGSARWSLADAKGRRPVLVLYWLTSSPRSLEMIGNSSNLVRDLLAADVEVVAMTAIPPGESEAAASEAVRPLKLDIPVLLDEGFDFARRLGIDSVPAVSFVDASGALRLLRAAHPGQVRIEGGTVEDWLRSGLAKKAWASAGSLERYEPVSEMVGRAAPDFTLPDISSLKPVRFSDLRATDRPTVLYFWSATCPKCVDGMPELAAWWDRYGKARAALVGVATANDDEMRIETTQFMTVAGVHFPVLYDRDLDLKPVYRVITTPTFLLIGADGTVLRYATGSRADLPGLLGPPGAAPAAADAPAMSIETAPAPPPSLP